MAWTNSTCGLTGGVLPAAALARSCRLFQKGEGFKNSSPGLNQRARGECYPPLLRVLLWLHPQHGSHGPDWTKKLSNTNVSRSVIDWKMNTRVPPWGEIGWNPGWGLCVLWKLSSLAWSLLRCRSWFKKWNMSSFPPLTTIYSPVIEGLPLCLELFHYL